MSYCERHELVHIERVENSEKTLLSRIIFEFFIVLKKLLFYTFEKLAPQRKWL